MEAAQNPQVTGEQSIPRGSGPADHARSRCLRALQRLGLKHQFRGCPRIVTTYARLFLPRGVRPYRVANGNWMLLDASDYTQATMLFGIYGHDIRFVLQRLLRPGDTYVDIGAQLGYFTLDAQRCVGPRGSIHAFEPDPDVFPRLQKAAALNGAASAHLNPVAVGEAPGELDFYISNTKGLSSRLNAVECDVREQARVAMTDLDSYLERNHVDVRAIRLVKIDIEGGEPWALMGMRRLLSSEEAPLILAEYNPQMLQQATVATPDIRVTLSENGYQPYRLCSRHHRWLRRAVARFPYPSVELQPVDLAQPLPFCDLLFTRGPVPQLTGSHAS